MHGTDAAIAATTRCCKNGAQGLDGLEIEGVEGLGVQGLGV